MLVLFQTAHIQALIIESSPINSQEEAVEIMHIEASGLSRMLCGMLQAIMLTNFPCTNRHQYYIFIWDINLGDLVIFSRQSLLYSI